jgi:actin-like ATPase involved in cell morphogenesis
VAYLVGVDLGTTWTAAAIVRDDRAEVVTLGTRTAAIPSVLFLKDDGTTLVGDAAVRRGASEPGGIVREFKRRLGDPTPIVVGATPYSADALTAALLRWVIDTVREREGEWPDGVAVSFPANWGPYKQELLTNAIRLANLGDIPTTTVTEPEAAAISYAANERVEVGDVIAVYDLGGGTFDAAVLRKTADGFETLGRPEGIERLGGIDFDEAVFTHVTRALGPGFIDLDPDDPRAMAAVARLREQCVEAKEALSADTDVAIAVMLPTQQTEVRLTRAEFEAMIGPTLAPTVEALSRALRSADVSPDEVKTVLLVGGSSRIPLVAQLLATSLGRPVAIDADPKHAVALGAARFGAQAAAARAAAAVEPAPDALGSPTGPPAPAGPPSGPPPPGAPPGPPGEGVPIPPPVRPPVATKRWISAAGIALVVALVGAVTLLTGGGNGDGQDAAEGEIFLEAVGSTGTDPFTPSVASGETAVTPSTTPPVTSGGGGTGGATVVGATRGGVPGLFGGTRDQRSCDAEALIRFLTDEANAAKASAWRAALQAGGVSVGVGDITTYIRSLTPVVLLRDTRVTNHGFRNGRATPFQAVLQAGTAVLLDEFGVPRVKCACGNPLLPPREVRGSIDYRGTRWTGFSSEQVHVVVPAEEPLGGFVLRDPSSGATFGRPVGFEAGPDVDATLEGVVPPTTTTTTPKQPVDVTRQGQVNASSTFPGGEFPARLAVDGSTQTSWFSAGPEGGTSTYTWQGTEALMQSVKVISNRDHPEFPTGFGFGNITLQLFNAGGAKVFEQSSALPGTPDPDVLFQPNMVGSKVVLIFSGHEDPTCGGFAELQVMALV